MFRGEIGAFVLVSELQHGEEGPNDAVEIKTLLFLSLFKHHHQYLVVGFPMKERTQQGHHVHPEVCLDVELNRVDLGKELR